jgi:hypothetical protein
MIQKMDSGKKYLIGFNKSGYSLVVEWLLPKQQTGFRLSLPAPKLDIYVIIKIYYKLIKIIVL